MNRLAAAIILLLGLAACATDPSLGGGSGNVASGSAAGTATTGANSQLEHCAASMGTIGVDENQEAPWFAYLAQYQLPSTVPLLRLIFSSRIASSSSNEAAA